MPISSIGSGASLIPSIETPGRETRPTEQRVAFAQLATSASTDAGRAEFPERERSRMTEDTDIFGLTFNRRLRFEVDHDSNDVVVKIIDNATEEVVRVLPPEELQRLHNSQRETIGSLLSEQA